MRKRGKKYLAARQQVDEQTAARALEQVLDLAELLPARRRDALAFPPLPAGPR